MSKKKLFLLFTGLSICLSWYGINAKEAQIKQDEGHLSSSKTEEGESFFYTSPEDSWDENEAAEESHFTSSPSLEAVLQELSLSEEGEATKDTDEMSSEEPHQSFAEAANLDTMTEAEDNTAAYETSNSLPDDFSLDSIDVGELSEAFGHFIGKNLESPGFDFDVSAVIRGIKNAVDGRPSPMSEDDYEKALTYIQEHAFQVLAEQNLEEANRFMKENAQNDRVIELDDGKIQYEVKEEGKGDPVAEGSSPLIHYTGTYLDGTVFGSSSEGEPIAIPLDQTIVGLSKGIIGMREGESRKIYVHPQEGYGTSSHLPPNSLLVFEVKILKSTSQDEHLAMEGENDLEHTQ